MWATGLLCIYITQAKSTLNTRTHLADGGMDVALVVTLEGDALDELRDLLRQILNDGAFVWRGHCLAEDLTGNLNVAEHVGCAEADVELDGASKNLCL